MAEDKKLLLSNLVTFKVQQDAQNEATYAKKSDVASCYKPVGSKAAAELTSALLVAANLGNVYNLSSELVITDDNKGLFTDAVTADVYTATTDTTAIAGKTYYESDGQTPATYTAVTGVAAGADISSAGYFELAHGNIYPVGTNVGIIEATPADNSDPENPVAATYKFDVFGGIEHYATEDDILAMFP